MLVMTGPQTRLFCREALRPDNCGGRLAIVGRACGSRLFLTIQGELIMKAFFGISILGLLVGASAPVHATTYFAQAKCGGAGTYDIETNRPADDGCAFSTQNNTNFVEAGAEADPGGLHADAHGDNHEDGQATAVITDSYLVTFPGLAGTSGTLKFTYYVHGVTSDPGAKGKVLVSVDSEDVYTDPAAAIAFIQYIDGAETVAGQGAIGVSFQFGGANDIETALELESENGTINFDSTAELIGIQAFNSAGKPVAASIVGDSGIDYVALAASNAKALGLDDGGGVAGVPEASTWAMMLIGFAGLGGAALYRARRGAATSIWALTLIGFAAAGLLCHRKARSAAA
jgi:hypothetical protein